MSGMKKNARRAAKASKVFSQPIKTGSEFLLPVCVIVLAGCATTGVPTLKPPACPAWNDKAIVQLEVVLTSGLEIKDLEYHVAEQLRHCEALDAWLEDED